MAGVDAKDAAKAFGPLGNHDLSFDLVEEPGLVKDSTHQKHQKRTSHLRCKLEGFIAIGDR
jgi:hypothetical protein